jgi:hypothetical protein
MIKARPVALHIRHPELETPFIVARVVNDWWSDGRKVGYCLQFPGEGHYRYLTYEEIEELQGEEWA